MSVQSEELEVHLLAGGAALTRVLGAITRRAMVLRRASLDPPGAEGVQRLRLEVEAPPARVASAVRQIARVYEVKRVRHGGRLWKTEQAMGVEDAERGVESWER